MFLGVRYWFCIYGGTCIDLSNFQQLIDRKKHEGAELKLAPLRNFTLDFSPCVKPHETLYMGREYKSQAKQSDHEASVSFKTGFFEPKQQLFIW